MKEKPNLRQIQKWMSWLITDPKGVNQALKTRDQEPHPSCFSTLSPSSLDGLDVYAEAYFSRLSKVIENTFPSVKKLIKETEFLRICVGYLINQPSSSINIAEIGKQFPRYLRSDSSSQNFPFLAALADLEWATTEAIYSPIRPLLDPNKLRTISQKNWMNTRFTFDPSVSLLQSDWPVINIWNDDSTQLPKTPQTEWILVHRNQINQNVLVSALNKQQWKTLNSLLRQMTLGEVCERLSKESEENITWITPSMNKWMQTGVFQKVETLD